MHDDESWPHDYARPRRWGVGQVAVVIIAILAWAALGVFSGTF